MLLTTIPYFKEIVVSSFRCDKCGHRDTEIQSAGEIQRTFDFPSMLIHDLSMVASKSRYLLVLTYSQGYCLYRPPAQPSRSRPANSQIQLCLCPHPLCRAHHPSWPGSTDNGRGPDPRHRPRPQHLPARAKSHGSAYRRTDRRHAHDAARVYWSRGGRRGR